MEERAFFNRITTVSSRNGNLLLFFSAIFTSIAGMMLFQDYLESRRVGRSFYFSESFLFKTIWFLFIPFLLVLYNQLKKQNITGRRATALFIVVPIFTHYLVLSVVFFSFSFLFYGGRYDLYKILSYTLSNDLTVLVVIYSSFVLGYKYFSGRTTLQASREESQNPQTIVINNGKNNSIVQVSEIVQIVAATPYVEIYTQNKKYLHTSSLKSIQSVLDKKEFLRVHRSAIVNIYQVRSFKSRLNGDYDLQLKDGEQVRLSRTYAAGFKNALANRVAS